MKKTLLLLPIFLFQIVGCSNQPVGRVVSETGTNTFKAKYAGADLNVGDKVRIIKMESNYTDESAPPAVKKEIGEGRVSTILKGHYYEITTETAQHIPTDALIEKL